MNGTVNIPAMAGAMLVTLCISTPGSLIAPDFRLAPDVPGGLVSAGLVDWVMVLTPWLSRRVPQLPCTAGRTNSS
jgi:hypothetical protein